MEPKKYPLLDLNSGEPGEIKLLFDDFKSGSSDRGPWWLYGIEYNGTRHNWFPDELTHTQIQAARHKKGAVLKVVGGEKGTLLVSSSEAGSKGSSTFETRNNDPSYDRVERMVERLGVIVTEIKDAVIALTDAFDEFAKKHNADPF